MLRSRQFRHCRHHRHFLTFRSKHSAAQWWAESRHFSVSRALFCPVCCVKQLQNAVQRVNGSQRDKRRAVMLYRVCFHTRSQMEGWIDCSCLTAQQTDKLLESAELIGWQNWGCPGCQELPHLLRGQLSCQSNVSFLLAYRTLILGSQWQISGRWQSLLRWYCKVRWGQNQHTVEPVGMGFSSTSGFSGGLTNDETQMYSV